MNFLNLTENIRFDFTPPETPIDNVKLFWHNGGNSRTDRRQIEREAHKIIIPLLEVEEIFLLSVFGKDAGMTYEEVYLHCHNEFKKRITRLKQKQQKLIKINERYFEQLYSVKHFKN